MKHTSEPLSDERSRNADDDLSPTMRVVVDRLREAGGTITRLPGGYWCILNEAGETVHPTYGTSTIQALVRRGVLVYSEYKQSHGRQFPICATLDAKAKGEMP